MGKQLNIGLLGMGVVGSGVCQVLAEQKEAILARTGVSVQITKALASPYEDKSALAAKYGFALTNEANELFEDETIDVIVELIGKIDPAKAFISAALENKKHVVTANKDLIATHGPELLAIAEKAGVSLYYEASVGGGIPILRTLSTHYLPDTITGIFGIVNGTTNYMLTKMTEDGMTYEDALSQAQAKGFAESDPTNDVDGIDAAYKMVILTKFAFGKTIHVADVATKGIRGLAVADIKQAQAFGYEVKLIGAAQKTVDGSLTVSVGPVLVPKNHALATIQNEFNGIFIESEGIDQSMVYGPGAGSRPTATSVVADLTVLAKNKSFGIVEPFLTFEKETALASVEEVPSRHYVSFSSQEIKGNALPEWFAFEQTVFNEADHRIAGITNPMSEKELTEKLATYTDAQDIQIMKVMEE
ncbi:homoserine dehydrogenase [Enterococcus casseliflavus]|uniref:homoserine dehydrogenase n=1 Tax=Enterococcus casseliflavus TaxID=37734 RepID=UPI001AD73E75|nr:homoserine dehydrogenase [Enterococcus casseliflavus]MBO6357045.1 homoserine dehydrogenase [Enterococcus casseliflavus]MBO6376981.1 homoserine dehydrogenase [Enterococcus casseliflavus]